MLEDNWIKKIKSSIPELPDKKKERFIKEYGLSEYDSSVIVSDKSTSDYYEKVVQDRNPKLVTTWVTSELFSVLNKKNLSIDESPIAPNHLGELIDYIDSGKISSRQAKDIFEEMCETGETAQNIINEKGLSQISDKSELKILVESVLSSNPENVEKYKNGKDKLFGFFVGEAMKLSKGKANPKILNELLKSKLNS